MSTCTEEVIRVIFGERLRECEPLARYTSARVGGPADYLVVALSAEELAQACRIGWEMGLPLFILGGGSNVLVSDAGFRGLVVLNHARRVEFTESPDGVRVRAESGANIGSLARQCVMRGYRGIEWAAAVPGTVGGAVFGNAGAHGGDMAGSLVLADILQRDGSVQEWTSERLGFAYRSSILKREPGEGIVLSADLRLWRGGSEEAMGQVDQLVAHRKRTQPGGASIGSMFKNPPGDYAGRLIEAAGLKGYRVGNAEISTIHANFFLNDGDTRASDVKALIDRARDEVEHKFGVRLELEVELVGEW